MDKTNYTSDDIESRYTPGAGWFIYPPLLLILIKQNKGIGVFAKRQLQPKQTLYETSDEYFSIIYRRYWKEVCGFCYNYDSGLDWKLKENHIGVVFCSEECRSKFMKRIAIAPDLHAFLISVEEFSRKRKQLKTAPDPEDDDIIPDRRIIEESWTDSQNTLLDIVNTLASDKPNKAQRKLLSEVQAAGLRAYDEDSDTDIDSIKNLASYIATNVLSPSTVAHTLTLSTTIEPCTLSRLLDQQINHYLALVSLLPPSLSQYALSAPSIAKILAVDRSNSFGIWSGSSDLKCTHTEERSELLGSMLVPSLSRFNHSCSPTVSKQRSRHTWTFSTTDVVNADQEIFITYLGGDEKTLNVDDRRQRLVNGWGFICGCVKCTNESTQSDID
ncbi:hypothetical protein E3P92_00877 [Wallemia ichthyophaga]|nr:hypothetical protein E3P98_00604 [Wallemia ichthyophaga]TIB17861.1 hypothetical protein E3P92_00877 [Wallemia ichthyophaga]TIB36909.1 hypothetical protein E3P84_00639 [Wallemia ichthyophaga]TIB43320.1 hypothetical protein E3P83_00789 [Wallemia ichthyophaga]